MHVDLHRVAAVPRCLEFAAFARVDQLNAILSDYAPDSEISRLSQRTADGPMAQPVQVSEATPDGGMRSRPLEDLAPLLPRDELAANMRFAK